MARVDWVEWLESVLMASAFVDGQMGRAHKKVDYFLAPEDRPNHNSKRNHRWGTPLPEKLNNRKGSKKTSKS